MTLSAVREKINEERGQTNIKDNILNSKLSVLINNICFQKLDNTYIFFKHFASKKKGIIYQLLLSGNDYDGIYEFNVFGHNVKFRNIITEEGSTIFKIETTSNFDLAEFDVKDETTTIIKKDELQFKREVNSCIKKISLYDIILIHLEDDVIKLNNNFLGETRTKKQIREILKNSDDILKIDFIEKKKKHFISRYDLGEEEFKKQLIELNLISEEEYKLFTNFNDELNKNLETKFKKVEII